MDMAWYGMYVKIYGISDDINVPKSNLGDRPASGDRLNPEGHANLK
jgi:hypothetical protein